MRKEHQHLTFRAPIPVADWNRAVVVAVVAMMMNELSFPYWLIDRGEIDLAQAQAQDRDQVCLASLARDWDLLDDDTGCPEGSVRGPPLRLKHSIDVTMIDGSLTPLDRQIAAVGHSNESVMADLMGDED